MAEIFIWIAIALCIGAGLFSVVLHRMREQFLRNIMLGCSLIGLIGVLTLLLIKPF